MLARPRRADSHSFYGEVFLIDPPLLQLRQPLATAVDIRPPRPQYDRLLFCSLTYCLCRVRVRACVRACVRVSGLRVRLQLALLMFGGEISLKDEKRQLSIDSWITFDAPPADARLLVALRRELDRVLNDKMKAPITATAKQEVVEAVACAFDPALG
eukprot:COSAG06_NODE_8227_length_2231_cov_1.208724_2_plen_157_part_00